MAVLGADTQNTMHLFLGFGYGQLAEKLSFTASHHMLSRTHRRRCSNTWCHASGPGWQTRQQRATPRATSMPQLLSSALLSRSVAPAQHLASPFSSLLVCCPPTEHTASRQMGGGKMKRLVPCATLVFKCQQACNAISVAVLQHFRVNGELVIPAPPTALIVSLFMAGAGGRR